MASNEEQSAFNAPNVWNRTHSDYQAVPQHITFLTNKNHQLENENNCLKLKITGMEEKMNGMEKIISGGDNLEKRGRKRMRKDAGIKKVFITLFSYLVKEFRENGSNLLLCIFRIISRVR